MEGVYQLQQKEKEGNWKVKNNKREIQEKPDTIRRRNIRIMGILEEDEKKQELESILDK